ncbi:MAG: hypothetical protein HKN47_05605 [Pirellulaceae bacterium]|nr:hypothetical protein [Pirellulaceae bacterium]
MRMSRKLPLIATALVVLLGWFAIKGSLQEQILGDGFDDVAITPVDLKASQSHAVDGERMIHGPISCKNIDLFVITGKEILKDAADYVTLDEAMKNEWVVVHETGNVNQLAVENITQDRTVVIMAGAVVKGGKQDRVLSLDMVLKPKSGKVPIASFCVEQSRWTQRGSEKLNQFSANSAQVSGKGLRKAVKGGKGQGAVWKEVASEQIKISRSINVDVQANESPTSFQLAIENKTLQKEAASYKAALAQILDQYPDAIGYAVAINGEFSTADVYASRGLFRKMWDQHLSSAVTEAISLKDEPAQKLDLTWRDEMFKEKSFETKIQKQTGGDNDYIADQNQTFFRYNSVLPKQGQIAVRMSYEKREEGESLDQIEANRGAQREMQQRVVPQQLNDFLDQ